MRWGACREVAMLTAVLPVVGVLVGASLQYLFTRYLETQRYQRDLRTQAYLDYIKSVSGLARLNDPQGSQERDLLANAADAKARICLYGSGEVVKALASFEKLGAAVISPPQCESFVAMIMPCVETPEMLLERQLRMFGYSF
jgi:hypothetical protein